MLPSLSQILVFIEHYKYIVIFPVMIVEGPIITIISGFLVSLGFLNVYIVFPLLLVGDLIGDSLYYAIGKYGRHILWLKKIGHFLGYNAQSKKYIEGHFEKHTIKTLLIAKLSHGLGAVVQVTAGIAKVNFLKYLWVEVVGTIPKTLFLLIIGYYLGSYYLKINGYLHLIAFTLSAIAIFVFLYLIINKYIKNSLQKD